MSSCRAGRRRSRHNRRHWRFTAPARPRPSRRGMHCQCKRFRRRRRRSTVNYAPFDMPVSLDDVPRAARDRHSPVCSADLSPSIRGLPLSSPAQKGSLVSATRSGPSSAPKVFLVASAEFSGPCEPRGEHRSFLRPPRLVLPRAGSPVRCCGPRGRLVPRLLG